MRPFTQLISPDVAPNAPFAGIEYPEVTTKSKLGTAQVKRVSPDFFVLLAICKKVGSNAFLLPIFSCSSMAPPKADEQKEALDAALKVHCCHCMSIHPMHFSACTVAHSLLFAGGPEGGVRHETCSRPEESS